MTASSPVAKARKSDIGWNEEAKLWLCRALIHIPDANSKVFVAYSKDLPGIDPAYGETEAEAIVALKEKLKLSLIGHLGRKGTGKIPFSDISGYRPHGSYYKVLGVDAPEPKKDPS